MSVSADLSSPLTASAVSVATEVLRMLTMNDVHAAFSLADEACSDANREWRQLSSSDTDVNRATRTDAAKAASVLRGAFAETCLALGRLREAYTNAISGLSLMIGESIDSPAQGLDLCLTAWTAVERLLNNAAPDPERKTAVQNLTETLGSLLYHYYNASGHADPDNPALADAYDTLKLLNTLVTLRRIEPSVPVIESLCADSIRAGIMLPQS